MFRTWVVHDTHNIYTQLLAVLKNKRVVAKIHFAVIEQELPNICTHNLSVFRFEVIAKQLG